FVDLELERGRELISRLDGREINGVTLTLEQAAVSRPRSDRGDRRQDRSGRRDGRGRDRRDRRGGGGGGGGRGRSRTGDRRRRN
ncbi:MAG: hypothetical protein KDD44_11700, partial [Bdellovibrionales bacterium]|nr:hypothetical protein [Bdellovibrionales bacterium]